MENNFEQKRNIDGIFLEICGSLQALFVQDRV
jgi:hypothetical protein